MWCNPAMRLADFDYPLPAELIAQHPAPERSGSRLLAVDGPSLADLPFTALPELMQPADLLVFNDTKVIKARLLGRKDSGGQVEAMVERIVGEREAQALIRASHAPREGSRLHFEDCDATVVGRIGQAREGLLPLYLLTFTEPVAALLDRIGRLPLPPYIDHAGDADDESRYQTVYASRPGAVAAPTAGLHFDERILARLRERGVGTAMLTLHVGAGTFLPVRTENLAEHRMHSERFEIPVETARLLAQTRSRGGRIVAVGTTSLRALEASGGRSGSAETDIFITPGYRFSVVDALVTNFHLPKSTLLMLVSAFAGVDTIRRAYCPRDCRALPVLQLRRRDAAAAA